MKNLITAIALVALAFFTSGAFADGANLFSKATTPLTTSEQSLVDSTIVGGLSYSVVSIDSDAFFSSVLNVALPTGKSIQFAGKKTEVKDGFTWRGDSKSRDTIAITSVQGGLFGVINSGGKSFQILGINSKTQLISEMKPFAGEGDDVIKHPPSDTPFKIPPVPQSTTPGRMKALGLGDPTINVLTVYTAVARAAMGGTGNMLSAISAAISDTQVAFNNSNVHLNVQSVGTLETPINYPTTSFAISHDVGVYVDVTAMSLRDSNSADVVMMITSTTSGEPGTAFENSNSSIDPYFAQGAIDYRSFATYTYTHEFGHILGAGHNVEAGGLFGPLANSKGWWVRKAYTPYSDAYCWHTVMSYTSGAYTSTPSCGLSTDPRILYFSNPSVTFGGDATGTSTANNVASINVLGPNVPYYRYTLLAPRIIAPLMVPLFINALDL